MGKKNTIKDNIGDIVLYETEDGLVSLEVNLQDDTIWLNMDQIATLYDKAKSTISEHIQDIFKDGELIENEVMKKFGNSEFSKKPTNYYNLDVVIAVGYRVRSNRGIAFRKWATKILKEYIKKGFAMDDERLKNLGGGNYWKELLDRIRDIRSSEKVLYRQVLDLYATSVDYDPKSEETKTFFKIVQNKFHYAANKMTATEVIYERADSEKPFMGLKSFTGKMPQKKDISIAKNYLDEKELKILNNLVSGYFDLAEVSAMEHRPMYMKDYIENIDSLLKSMNRPVLTDSGKVSHNKAIEKAETEYKKYINENLSEIDKEYFKSIREIENNVKKNNKD